MIYRDARTASEIAIADRRALSLTSGADPLKLSNEIRKQLIEASDRQIASREKYEREALEVEKQKLDYNKQIAENTKKLISIAEKQGLKGIETILKIVDETNGAVEIEKAPTADDVTKLYGEYQGALR